MPHHKKSPQKAVRNLEKKREKKVRWLIRQRYLRSDRIKEALLRVPRKDFIPPLYRDYAFLEVPIPLHGKEATISCPHSYPLFYEPLGLDRGHQFLEVGLGSAYGAAVVREVVGPEGPVVSIEIELFTFEFRRKNLEKRGYHDIVLVNDDGSLGNPGKSPYDRISITVACLDVPPPLIEKLKIGGRLILPCDRGWDSESCSN